MRNFVALALLLQTSVGFASPNECLRALLRDYTLKLTNQVYHIRNSNFAAFRTLHYKINHRNYPIQKRWVKLFELRHMHPVNYPIPSMWDKVNRRIEALRVNKADIAERGLSLTTQKELIPSREPLRVIQDAEGRYVVKDGNGRLYAIREVFGDNPNLAIEVEDYVSHVLDILVTLDKIRAANGLTD